MSNNVKTLITVKSKLQIVPHDKQLTVDKNNHEALPDPKKYQIVMGLISQKGGGKSTVLLNLLNGFYKKKFDNIFMICPSVDKKFDEIREELIEDEKYYDLEDLSFDESLTDIYIKLQESVKEDDKVNNLLVLDDVMVDFSNSKILNRVVANSRHLRLSIFYTSQYYRKVPSVLRSNTDVWCIWNTNNLLERKKYQDEMNCNHLKLEEYFNVIQNIPHSFITISFVGGQPRYYLNFDRIVD